MCIRDRYKGMAKKESKNVIVTFEKKIHHYLQIFDENCPCSLCTIINKIATISNNRDSSYDVYSGDMLAFTT